MEGEVVVGDLLVGEPHGDLVLSAVGRVAAVDDVAANGDAKVATDAASLRVVGVGGTHELAALLDDVGALPDHADDGARGEVLAEARVELEVAQVLVVGLRHLEAGVEHLEADQLVATRLEALDDLTDQVALHTIGLDGDEGALLVGAGSSIAGHLGSSKGLALVEVVAGGRAGSKGSTPVGGSLGSRRASGGVGTHSS